MHAVRFISVSVSKFTEPIIIHLGNVVESVGTGMQMKAMRKEEKGKGEEIISEELRKRTRGRDFGGNGTKIVEDERRGASDMYTILTAYTGALMYKSRKGERFLILRALLIGKLANDDEGQNRRCTLHVRANCARQEESLGLAAAPIRSKVSERLRNARRETESEE